MASLGDTVVFLLHSAFKICWPVPVAGRVKTLAQDNEPIQKTGDLTESPFFVSLHPRYAA